MRTRTNKACQGDIANKKLKEQLLGRATHYSSTGLSLKHNNFNKKLLEHVLSMLLLTSTTRPVINNKFVETKRELTWWERVSLDETCMRVRERMCLGLL
jgi:hypothetical protein